jgi:hypothetical protein
MREIKVPIKLHVKKLLIAEYGPEPILASQQSVLGYMVSSRMANQRNSTYDNRSKFENFIVLSLPHRIIHHQCINKKKIALISCHLDNIFRMLFINHINSQMSINVGLYDSIKNFFKRYQIEEEELSFDAAEAIYKRYKKKNSSQKIMVAHPSC